MLRIIIDVWTVSASNATAKNEELKWEKEGITGSNRKKNIWNITKVKRRVIGINFKFSLSRSDDTFTARKFHFSRLTVIFFFLSCFSCCHSRLRSNVKWCDAKMGRGVLRTGVTEKETTKYLLEEIRSIFVAKKWHGICQHPDIATAAIIIRFRPSSIFIFDRKYFIHFTLRAVRV